MGRNFLQRLTRTIRMDRGIEDEQDYLEESPYDTSEPQMHIGSRSIYPEEVPEEVGELAVDVFQTPDSIYIKAMVAGVRKSDLEIVITREMVSVSGIRREVMNIDPKDYYHQELYWGAFSRSIQLPQEVDIDHAQATAENGLIVIKLPKVDRNRAARIKIA